MKKYHWVILLGFILTAACVIYVPYHSEEGPPPEEEEYFEEDYGRYDSRLDVSHFYEYLSPYGIWAYYPPHGYVWVPRVTRYGWRPYTYGRWVWTDYGWTWVSYYKWGWAPFHYGRWGWDNDLGWFWMPDTIWGPAWVTWRRSNLYIGWAPLPPQAHFVVGVGITSLSFPLPGSSWIFVEGRYFLNTNIHRYVIPFERNMTIINYTIIRTNIIVRDRRVINRGIDIDRIRRVTKQRITPYELREVRRPQTSKVRMDQLEVYRPSIRKNQMAKPKTVLDKNEAKQKISTEAIREIEEETLPYREEIQLEDVHKREKRLLERSQEEEVKELEGELEEEKKTTKSTSEKEKVEKEYKEKIVKLKKDHETEKSQIEKRHKKEKETVKKKKIKKKK